MQFTGLDLFIYNFLTGLGKSKVPNPSLEMEIFSLKVLFILLTGLILLQILYRVLIKKGMVKGPKDKNLIRTVTVNVLIIILFFGLWEITLRAFEDRFPVMNPLEYNTRKWLLEPNLKGYTLELNDNETVLDTNSEGLRNAPVPEKVPGEIRILFLGDSWTIGQGVPEDKTFVRLVETKLRKAFPGKKITVINGGMFGYSIYQGYNLFSFLKNRYKPDLLVLSGFNYMANRDLPAYYRYEAMKGTKLGGMRKLLYKSLAYRALRRTLSRLNRDQGALKEEKLDEETAVDMYKYFAEKMYSECRNEGIQVVAFDHFDMWTSRQIYGQWDKIDDEIDLRLTPDENLYGKIRYDMAYYREFFWNKQDQTRQEENPIAEFPNVAYYVIAPNKNLLASPDLYLINDPHPSEKGHEAMADSIFHILKDYGYIDNKSKSD